MQYSRALEIIHELAFENQIDEHDIAAGDKGLAAQAQWQSEALDTLGDLLSNHHEAIDERFALPKPEEVQAYPVEAVAADRAMSPSDPVSAIRISLDLSRGNLLDFDPDMEESYDEQQLAVSLVEDFIVRHGDALAASMTTIKLG